MMLSKHLIFCCPHLLLPSVFPSVRVFSSESALCIRWPKYWSSASASVLPMNIQGWLPLGLTGLISLLSRGLSRVFSNTTFWKHQLFDTQPSLWSNCKSNTCSLYKKLKSSREENITYPTFTKSNDVSILFFMCAFEKKQKKNNSVLYKLFQLLVWWKYYIISALLVCYF